MSSSSSPESGPGAAGCLSDAVLVDLLDGRLSDDSLARAHHHAAGCAPCRVLLASAVRGGLAETKPVMSSDPEPGAPSVLEPGLPWTPPEVFDEFRLERVLGRGGMGIVYLAHDTSLDRRVAVKFIASQAPEPWVRAYFETEARVIARLQHPNVVTVFRVGAVGGHPYIVSEYVVGQSLAELPLPVPWRRVLSLGIGLARGLAAAHRQGVLHRDIKPSNVLVTREGEVKLLDFGLASSFETEAAAPSARTRHLVGTRPYLAPELLTGAPATPLSDVYALGLVLHELCTGARTAGGPEIEPDFQALIARCLAPNPLERFPSADALCEGLERLERRVALVPLVVGNPYRGLAPFEAEHCSLFFGRDADIRAVLERLRHRPLVLIAGDSGTGKSSLCRAGVLPRVDAETLGGAHARHTVILTPGRRPLEALAAALAPVLNRQEAQLLTALVDAPVWLGRTLREEYQGARGLLLFVDQLEELMTLSEEHQAVRFARFLGELALPSRGVRVLLTVRGDFLTRLCALPGLGDEAERGLYILRPLSHEGMHEAIVGPARGQGVAFESEQLVQTLVDSAALGVGSLPLLQFTLAELWERRHPAQGRITREVLDEMGGVAGALSRHADGVLWRLSPHEREVARRLMLLLVTGEGMRIERAEEELVESSDASSHAVLRALVEGRLLHTRTMDERPRYVIAHDTLIESWGTLRDWRDDDIGQRAVLKRVEAASAEWERLMRAREALWGRRQLEEVRPLKPTSLGPRERAFLLASERAVARQRWGRWLMALALVLTVIASYGGVRLQMYLEDGRYVAEQVALANKAFASGRDLAARATRQREQAMALFDPLPPGEFRSPEDPRLRRGRAEQQWREVLKQRAAADKAYAQASRLLEQALYRDRDHVRAQQLLAELLYERVLLAEEFYQRDEREEWAQRLDWVTATFKEGLQWRQKLLAPAELEFELDPPDASVTVERVESHDGQPRREPSQKEALTCVASPCRMRLPPGSYRLHAESPGRVPVMKPLLLAHGESRKVQLTLVKARVPEGYVYIAPGCFLLGSAEPELLRKFMLSSPLHRFCLREGYLIGRHEVTFGEWVEYLDALPRGASARRILESGSFGLTGAVKLRKDGPGTDWHLDIYRSRGAEPFTYPGRTQPVDWRRLPLSGVSARDLKGYLDWLDSTGRLPGARLCDQNEWEYAARGADGRVYPHGNELQPDDANIDETYGRRPEAYGPDMVGSHPASDSPFGLQDMAGNAFEITRSTTPSFGEVVLRGGAWYYDSFGAYIANISAGDPTLRDAAIGVRVCASLPATRDGYSPATSKLFEEPFH